MVFKFSPEPPSNFSKRIPVISGPPLFHLDLQEYLIVEEEGTIKNVYEIKFDYRCSPFKEAFILGNRLAVGSEGYFYLFDLENEACKLRLQMQGYFGHIYQDNERIFVCDSAGAYCFDTEGVLLWRNKNLGIDGVILNKIDDNCIYGSGEWDPPGGWRDFVLDKHSGVRVDK